MAYDLDRRRAVMATGDNASEWMEAGADPDELMELGLLDDDDRPPQIEQDLAFQMAATVYKVLHGDSAIDFEAAAKLAKAAAELRADHPELFGISTRPYIPGEEF